MTGRLSRRGTIAGGGALLALAFAVAASSGAYAISTAQLWQVVAAAWQGAGDPSPQHLVFMNILVWRAR